MRTVLSIGRLNQRSEFWREFVTCCPTTDRWVPWSWRTTLPRVKLERSFLTSACWVLYCMRALMSLSCGCYTTPINSSLSLEMHTHIRYVFIFVCVLLLFFVVVVTHPTLLLCCWLGYRKGVWPVTSAGPTIPWSSLFTDPVWPTEAPENLAC